MKHEINRHASELREQFTIEFDVKYPRITVSDKTYEYEYATGAFTNPYSARCFKEILRKVTSRTWRIKDWTFAGRSNGWFVLLCDGDKDRVTENQLNKLEEIVERYFKNYGEELAKYYSS